MDELEYAFFVAKRLIIDHLDDRIYKYEQDPSVGDSIVKEIEDIRRYIKNYILYKKT